MPHHLHDFEWLCYNDEDGLVHNAGARPVHSWEAKCRKNVAETLFGATQSDKKLSSVSLR
jgi:hypothetical protein